MNLLLIEQIDLEVIRWFYLTLYKSKLITKAYHLTLHMISKMYNIIMIHEILCYENAVLVL